MAHRVRRGLSVLGVVVTISGFYASKAPSLPRVLGVLAPGYAGALRGLATLERSRSLSPSDDGFSGLASAVAQQLVSSSGDPAPASKITRFEVGTAMIALSETHAGEHVPFRIFVVGQAKPVEADFGLVRDYVNQRGQGDLLIWSQVFFWIGIAITVASNLVTS
jgi:hypothetical protein